MACTLAAQEPLEPAAGGLPGAWLCPLPFLPARQPSGAAGLDHALGVRMPAAPVVALREQQHVLAQRRQETAAERTAVRRRLAVLGSADLPPPGCGGSGHLSRG